MARPPKPSQSAGAELDQAIMRQIDLRLKWLLIWRKALEERINLSSASSANLTEYAMIWEADEEVADLRAAQRGLRRLQKKLSLTDKVNFEWDQDALEWREDKFENRYLRSAVIYALVAAATPDES